MPRARCARFAARPASRSSCARSAKTPSSTRRSPSSSSIRSRSCCATLSRTASSHPRRAQLATDADVLDALGTGVSVRGDADELAGRGIGLDLVRQTVARLGGEVKVLSSATRGTTFSLRLPLSTSLAQAMLFKVGGQVYAIPAVHVVDTTQVDAQATSATMSDEVLPV